MKLQLSLLLIACGACVDARDEYVDFGERLPDAAPPVDAPIVSELPDVTGEFLVRARPNLTEDRFVTFRATVVMTPTSANTALLDWSGQPLDYETLEPVGAPLVEEDVAFGADAMGIIPFVGTIPGRANSISGTQVEADGLLHTTLVTADFFCGTLTGRVGSFPLEGSTFAAVRITGKELPTPLYRCEDGPQR